MVALLAWRYSSVVLEYSVRPEREKVKREIERPMFG
jgi:hypothetical protein